MASAAICSATALFLAVAIFASVSSASHPLAAAEATDHAITKTSNLLPVHNDRDKKMEEAKASAEEEGKKTGFYRGKAKKLDDDDDGDDSDPCPDPDHDHDHDSDSDHDHDSDSDHDDDSGSDHDDDSGSDHDHDHDSDSGDNGGGGDDGGDNDGGNDDGGDNDGGDDDGGDNDGGDDDDHNSKTERKKHAAQGRKGAPGGKRDDKLPKVAKKV